MPTDDIAVQLRTIGFRASSSALRAFFEHASQSRWSPVETCEKLVELERRERDTRNLASRTRRATLGKLALLTSSWKQIRRLEDWGATRGLSSRGK